MTHVGWRGRIDRLKLGALDDVSIRRAFAAMAKEPGSGERYDPHPPSEHQGRSGRAWHSRAIRCSSQPVATAAVVTE